MKNIIKTSVLFIILVFISVSTIAQNKGYKVGDEATNFTLENIDGKKLPCQITKMPKNLSLFLLAIPVPILRLMKTELWH